jgi:cytochrome c nitrite reductase small subunit
MKNRRLQITICALLIGMAAGLGIYTFGYAKGGSYLTNNPAACANCHIMQSQYDAWQKSSHQAVATCNDCHTPAGFLAKYMTKASNGFWHSFAFTTGRFHEPIQIKARNREIADHACRKCHAEMTESIEGIHRIENEEPLSCVRCHGSVGHPQ